MRGSRSIEAVGGGSRLAILVLAVGLMAAAPGGSRGEEPLAAQDWVSKRVVQKHEDSPLHDEGRAFPGSGEVVTIYRIARVEGRRLWLEAEGSGSCGWADIDEVVPLDRAIGFFTDQIRAHPGDVLWLVLRAMIWTDQGNFDRALEDCNEAIHCDPRACNYVGRAIVWIRKGDPDRAIADLDEAIKREPQGKHAFDTRGGAWVYKKSYDKAIADFTEAIRLDPKFSSAYSNRGAAWVIKEAYDKALADLNEAIRLNPLFSMAYSNRGKVWLGKHEYDKAIADYDQALRLDPRSVEALTGRGELWYHKSEYDKAIVDFTEALRRDPKDAAAYLKRGFLWRLKGDFIKANAQGLRITLGSLGSIVNDILRSVSEHFRA